MSDDENKRMEFHDSTLESLRFSDSSVSLHFCPACFHHSHGDPGVDPGSVWLQDAILTVGSARVVCQPTSLPLDVFDGLVSINGDQVFNNGLPVPCCDRGDVVVSLDLSNRERLVVLGKTLDLTRTGKARYLEEFP